MGEEEEKEEEEERKRGRGRGRGKEKREGKEVGETQTRSPAYSRLWSKQLTAFC